MIDAIELEVMRHLFASIAEEMGVTLKRSAFSANIKERRDYSCAIFDASGEMVAQAAHIPVHLGSTPMSVRAALDAFPQGIPSGEHVLLNDPYQGGTHLPDLTLVSPVYDALGALRFVVANRAHHADVGGLSPGSLPLSRHIDEEGFRTGPRLLTPKLKRELMAASRTPDERRGDLLAQAAANRRGIRRLEELLARYGSRLLRGAESLQGYAERLMRVQIGAMPDGSWEAEELIEDDGHGHFDLALRCRLTIKGEQARFDFTDSVDQTEGPVNVPKAVTVSAVLYAMSCLLAREAPANGGTLRPLKVITRAGSILDARYPAAVAAGNVETSQRVTDLVFASLSRALPGRMPAQSCGTMNNVLIGGVDERARGAALPAPYAYYETIGGGSGASAEGAGADGIQTHMTNTLNTPVEALEHAYPLVITRYALRLGSGGQGQHRGGCGVTRGYRFTGAATVTLMTERRRLAPRGEEGGGEGAVGENAIRRRGQSVWQQLEAKVTVEVERGDEIEVRTPGGGGWGEAPQGLSPAQGEGG